ncbi:hypothetical protein H6G00_08040 [Leptolyngbya sp. FACHB-541]|uniref:hypothetical protein n=1 Tax=Leptolyngbya sp. FACHB-541 TaxID=2692810 RepID=UPI0016835EF2|nr:hypothetical protein [Leptolyngbya sp. FACHB-541]MBD1996568.1 hypothetical protein [Leptolyngbya sp. FACHB-541]
MITTEMRWFYPGSLPTAVRNWFQATWDQAIAPIEVREDQYLQLPKCEYLNLKLRHGSLELKLRLKQLRTLQVGDRWAGQVEVWQKWSLQDSSEYLDLADVEAEATWISVEKVRSQQQYQTFPAQPPKAISFEQQPEQGCRVELTELKVQDAAWWSLAFEAFGDPSQQFNQLQVVVEQISNPLAPTLDLHHSYAYPKWLLNIR